MDNLHITLFDLSEKLVHEWKLAFGQHVTEKYRSNFTIMQSKLSELPQPQRHFDCIVSPANSYGFLDGGFDYYLSLALAPEEQRDAPTRIAQSVLYEQWRGYAPPGTCTLVPLKSTVCANNEHRCSFIAICPTMRIPENVEWNREIVYNSTWSLLVAIDKHNRSAHPGDRIRTVVMTGLGTATGHISAERCAQQMALAVRDFIESSENPQKWGALDWRDALDQAHDTHLTHDL